MGDAADDLTESQQELETERMLHEQGHCLPGCFYCIDPYAFDDDEEAV